MSGIVYNPKSLAYNPEWKAEGHDCDTCPAARIDPREVNIFDCPYHTNRRRALEQMVEPVENGVKLVCPPAPDAEAPSTENGDEIVTIEIEGNLSGWGKGKVYAKETIDPIPHHAPSPEVFDGLKAMIEKTIGANAHLESIHVDVIGPNADVAADVKEALEKALRASKPGNEGMVMEKIMGFIQAPDKSEFMRGEILRSLGELEEYLARSARVATQFGWTEAAFDIRIAATSLEHAIKRLKEPKV
jgi:hypothetical protein